MIQKINVKALNQNYQIYIGDNIRSNLYEYIQRFNFSKVLILTDNYVKQLYLNDIAHSLQNNIPYETFIIDQGEKSKSMTTYEQIQSFLLENQFDRDSAIIALGGGVVGDLGGFVASTYMRGIGFVQMPTTLLAHDSSIGGKVAINLKGTKNIIGSFYPPHVVIYDTNTLRTLNEREIRSGFAEVIKHGFITDESYLFKLSLIMKDKIDIEKPSFPSILKTSIEIKQKIVEQDERESDVRKFLNLGHTLGHAFESLTDEQYTHGECVMYGLLFALYVSDEQSEKGKLLSEELISWIRQLKYPIFEMNDRLNIDDVIEKMLKDKKNKQSYIHLILLKKVGVPYVAPFSHDKVKQLVTSFQLFLNKMR